MTYSTLVYMFMGCIFAQVISIPFMPAENRTIEKSVNALIWQATAYISIAVVMWMESL